MGLSLMHSESQRSFPNILYAALKSDMFQSFWNTGLFNKFVVYLFDHCLIIERTVLQILTHYCHF